MSAQQRSRKVLLLIGLCFAAPMLASLILTRTGWMPSGRKNYGELLSTPLALNNVDLEDGSGFTWKKMPEWYWTLLVRVPVDCAGECLTQLDLIGNVRDALAQNATKLRIAVVDPLPQGAKLATAHGVYALAQPVDLSIDAVIARPAQDPRLVLVDPNGYAILRYPEQADLSRVRKDLAKLLK
jgi:hypothetical protein